ncbi:MAG: Guanylate kinase [Bacteroidia bacterium]|nr:Guanylate kinase [Bacteroidia bacterium]
MSTSGKLIIFSAPSGAGKTTLVRHLLEIPALNLAFSVSATSRAKRGYEEDGKDYFFLTAEEFSKKIKNHEFLEWEEVYKDQYYGTLKSEVDGLLKAGKNVIFDIDVEGGLNLKKIYGKEALAIFVKPPSIKHLEERLNTRSSEDEESLKTRLEKAVSELEYAPQFDKVLLNDKLEKAKRDAEVFVSDFLGINLD